MGIKMEDIQIFDRTDGRRIGHNDGGESAQEVLAWLDAQDWQYKVVIAKRIGIDPETGNLILEQLCNDCGENTGEILQADNNGLV